MAAINVTPLVDVMLVLLVIFMVTAPLLKAGIPIRLPDSRARPLDAEPKAVTISLARDGAIYLDDAALWRRASWRTGWRHCRRGAGGKPPAVVLRADRALDYGQVIAVMGELNHAGITAISLVTGVSGAGPASGALARTARGKVSAHSGEGH